MEELIVIPFNQALVGRQEKRENTFISPHKRNPTIDVKREKFGNNLISQI